MEIDPDIAMAIREESKISFPKPEPKKPKPGLFRRIASYLFETPPITDEQFEKDLQRRRDLRQQQYIFDQILVAATSIFEPILELESGFLTDSLGRYIKDAQDHKIQDPQKTAIIQETRNKMLELIKKLETYLRNPSLTNRLITTISKVVLHLKNLDHQVGSW